MELATRRGMAADQAIHEQRMELINIVGKLLVDNAQTLTPEIISPLICCWCSFGRSNNMDRKERKKAASRMAEDGQGPGGADSGGGQAGPDPD